MFFKVKEIEDQVEKVLAIDSVSKAQKVMQSRSGAWVIAAISFMESALPLPILTDPFLAAAILLNRSNAIRLVALTTAASVLGGILAYFTAVLFFEVIMAWMTPGIIEQFQAIVTTNESNTFMLTIVGAVTPVPYTLVAWVVAVIKGSFVVFVVASIVGRGLRYVIIGYSVYYFGPLAISYAKRYLGWTSVLILLIVILAVGLKV